MATAEGSSSLQGDNVCVYRITESGVQEISDSGVFTVFREGFGTNNASIAQDKALIVKKCCPGYQTLDDKSCIESRVSNPFSEGQFSYALIYLGILLLVVGLVSIVIAYRYHYRFQRNQKHGLISNSYDDAGVSHSLECQPISTNSRSPPREPFIQP